ncbi:MAG: sulfite exporter TauE/SafE family protein [Myxococcaceae bacterium]|nr:sulfite exporter TauE/SafE family protein [Myxococcaceae bacterium]
MMAFVVGTLLGLVFAVLGAGGGILAVPVLLVLFGTSLQTATGAGLAVVWAAALSGAVSHARGGRVDVKVAASFGLPSIAGAALGAKLHALVPERVSMVAFAVVLLVALVALFRPKLEGDGKRPRLAAMVLVGLVTGALTGFLGVGGGFLIVPALTLFAGLPLHRAIGTSMAVISLASLSGAVVHLLAGHVPFELVLPMGAGAVVGAFAGAPLAGKLPERPLRLGFATLSVVVAVGMLVKALGPA